MALEDHEKRQTVKPRPLAFDGSQLIPLMLHFTAVFRGGDPRGKYADGSSTQDAAEKRVELFNLYGFLRERFIPKARGAEGRVRDGLSFAKPTGYCFI